MSNHYKWVPKNLGIVLYWVVLGVLYCIGLLGDTYLGRYSLKEFGIQEGQAAQV